jgi:DNA-binding XRE family transcriptional regulator
MDIIEARARKRKNQWDVRLSTGIHQSRISLIENGYVEPTDKEKALIAKALGFDVDEIEWTKSRRVVG